MHIASFLSLLVAVTCFSGCAGLFDSLTALLRDDVCAKEALDSWSYRGENGPNNWGKKYPTCDTGKTQSPIDIDTSKVVDDPNLCRILLRNYDIPVMSAVVENNGHTAQMSPNDGIYRGIVVGQPPKNYSLAQLHFHWGDTPDKGSEHLIDGKGYANEVHFVHLSSENDIAVVGLFFKEQNKKNKALEPLVKSLDKIKYKGAKTNLRKRMNLGALLPENPGSYYRYAGSLTTPGCGEGVTWSVLKRIAPIGKKQMKEFRNMRSEMEPSDCKLVNNYRPVQPLNDRVVYSSV